LECAAFCTNNLYQTIVRTLTRYIVTRCSTEVQFFDGTG